MHRRRSHHDDHPHLRILPTHYLRHIRPDGRHSVGIGERAEGVGVGGGGGGGGGGGVGGGGWRGNSGIYE